MRFYIGLAGPATTELNDAFMDLQFFIDFQFKPLSISRGKKQMPPAAVPRREAVEMEGPPTPKEKEGLTHCIYAANSEALLRCTWGISC